MQITRSNTQNAFSLLLYTVILHFDIRHWPYKWGCLISEALQSTFEAVSPSLICILLRWLSKKNGKTPRFHFAKLRKWESVRTRCVAPYKWDIFIFEWGDSPSSPVPFRWGNTVCITLCEIKLIDSHTHSFYQPTAHALVETYIVNSICNTMLL